MIKEQEETIERVNKLLELEVTPFNNGKSVLISKTDLETVLNMLKEKDKEIETLKRDFKIVDQECSRLERKEAKQDKIIDLMAEDMIKGKCYFSSKTLLKKHYESKVEK